MLIDSHAHLDYPDFAADFDDVIQRASDGEFADILWMRGGGARHPITRENAGDHLQTIKMSGKEVYKQWRTEAAASKPATMFWRWFSAAG